MRKWYQVVMTEEEKYIHIWLNDLMVETDGRVVNFYIVQPPRALTTGVVADVFLRRLPIVLEELKKGYEEIAEEWRETANRPWVKGWEREKAERRAELYGEMAEALGEVIGKLEEVRKALDELKRMR